MNYSYTNADGRRSLVVVLDTGNAHTIPGSHPEFTELLHYLAAPPTRTTSTSGG